MKAERLRRALSLVLAMAIAATTAGCTAKTPDPVASSRPAQQGIPPMPVYKSTAPEVKGISAPAKLGGRAKITDSTHVKLVADAEAAIRAGTPTASSVFVAYYGTSDAKKDKIYLTGVEFSSTVSSPELERSLNLFARDMQGKPLLVTEMPPQSDVGAQARCGDVDVQGTPGALCGWTVKYYMVFVLWYHHVASELVKELPTIRGAVETKG